MRTRKLSLLLMLVCSTIFAQVPKKAISIEDEKFNDFFLNKKNVPTVKGVILNIPEKGRNKARIDYTIVTPYNERQIKKSCSLNADGSFELELDDAFPYQQIWMSVGRLFYAGIYAHNDLFIELDAKVLIEKKGVRYNGPGIKYQGKDSELNEFMNNHVLFKREKQLALSKELSKLRRDRGIEYAVFKTKYDSLYTILRELDDKFIKKNKSDYSWMIRNERQSDYYGNLSVKFWGKEMPKELWHEIKHHKAYLTSNSGMGFYNYLFTYCSSKPQPNKTFGFESYRGYSKLNSSDKLVMDSIVSIKKTIDQKEPFDTLRFRALIDKMNIFLHDTLTIDRTLSTVNKLDAEFAASKADFLKTKISSKDVNEQKLQMEAVLTSIKTDWCKGIIQSQYQNSVKKLSSINNTLSNYKPLNAESTLGKPIAETPFGAKLYKVDAMEAKDLLVNLKRKFAGKALLIDFWATWCGPCIAEMPYSKKLHDETKDLPVEFVYLCTSRGSDVNKWKTKIAEFKTGGTHIFVEEDIESELMKMFSLSGFPSYIFIDTNGEFKPGAVKRMSMTNKDQLTKLVGSSKSAESKQPKKGGKMDNILIMVEGKIISEQELNALNKKEIATISVVKDKEKVRQYTSGNYDGVILITMKEKI